MRSAVAKTFQQEVDDFCIKTEKDMDLAVRALVLELFSLVVERSPVDTGTFRANWQVSLGTPMTGTLDEEDKEGAVAINRIAEVVLGLKAGDTIYLANNLPYALALEEGHSDQAPNGMVALTMQELKDVAKGLGIELEFENG